MMTGYLQACGSVAKRDCGLSAGFVAALAMVLFRAGCAAASEATTDGSTEAAVAADDPIQPCFVCESRAGYYDVRVQDLASGPVEISGSVNVITRRYGSTKWDPAVRVYVGPNRETAVAGLKIGWSEVMYAIGFLSSSSPETFVRLTEPPDRVTFQFNFDEDGKGTIKVGKISRPVTVDREASRTLFIGCSGMRAKFDNIVVTSGTP